MPAFEYLALTADGRKRKGVLEADSQRQARQQLREQQLVPVTLNPVQESARRLLRLTEKRLSTADLALFTRQLATLVQSALPLDEALDVIARQTDNPRLRKTVMAVRSKVMEGHTLADSLEEAPRTFDSLYRAMVRAGEQSGGLERVLNRLADYTEQAQQLRNQIQLMLVYPVALSVVAIGVIALLMAFVVPKVIAQFQHFDQQLPWLTQWLILLSDGTRAYGLHLVSGLLLAALALRWYLRKESRRYRADRWLLRTPVVARVSLGLNTARFAQTLSILIACGLPMLEGVRTSARTLGNLFIREQVEKAAERVREGSQLSAALEQTRLFPPMMVYMIASGERSGQLAEMLNRAATHQEREFETRVTVAVKLFEPLLIITMGVLVLGIVLAILLPILQLNNLTDF